MIYQCLYCDYSFDSDTSPVNCPHCGQAEGFAEIRMRTADGRELTYKEHITAMREYYLNHVPYGMTKEDIAAMDDLDLESMADILSE